MMNHRLFNGIDNPEDVKNRNIDSFRFHGPMKSLYYKILKMVPEGDKLTAKWWSYRRNLVYTVMKLINPPPEKWIDHLRKYGSKNDLALIKIYDEYMEKETQVWRKEVVSRAFPFLICLTSKSGDPNYYELRDWVLYKLDLAHQRGEMEYCLTDIIPMNWWNEKKRGRGWIKVEIDGKETTDRAIEGGII
jgi:hypothetical protein